MKSSNELKEEMEEYKCKKCKDRLFILKDDVAYECECRQLRIAEDMLAHSGVSEELSKLTFNNFDSSVSKDIYIAYKNAIKYSDNFPDIRATKRNSILFFGQVGSGKTHLSMSIANELMNNCIGVIYMPYRDSITTLKHYILDAEKYSKEMDRYKNSKVLLIDDLYKGKITESDVNIMFEIVNYRYLKNLPLIISTEKTIDELINIDEAIASRIIERSKDYLIGFEGKMLNYRIYG